MKDRVCFYSKYDMSISANLALSEERIKKYKDISVQLSINDAIEMYNIIKLFDSGYSLNVWSEEYYTELKNQTKHFKKRIVDCFQLINFDNAVIEYKKLDWDYQQAFWEIISNFDLYHLINSAVIESIVELDDSNLIKILHTKGIVDKFAPIIKDLLLEKKNTAHLILNKYVAKIDNTNDKEVYFPIRLTIDEKESIIDRYLESADPNLNYVRLITQTRNGQSFRISPKTRLKAERLERKLNDELLTNDRTSKICRRECFALVDKKEAMPVNVKCDDKNNLTFEYSLPYIQSCSNTQVIANFISLFGWLNTNGLLNLINKRTEINSLEYVIMDVGRNSYPAFSSFQLKNSRLIYQMNIYSKALNTNNKSIELELKYFLEIILKKKYNCPSLLINIPSKDDTWLNKCRVLFPELDSLVKQYNTFVDEGDIDFELIKLLPPSKMTEGKSLLHNKKYYEINGAESEIWNSLNLLFSNQTLLAHVEPYKEKHYNNLAELLEKEFVAYDKYEEYQKPKIDYLKSLGFLEIDSSGILITQQAQMNVMKSLWEFGVCSYWHCNEEERNVLDDMLEKNWLKMDEHLLSKPERDYFSYYLDNSEFSNGYALRNIYAHGATSPSNDENTHMNAYYIFLRLLIILALKIEDDLWLALKVLSTYQYK